jgi:predicted secreted acid phosphatase
MKLLKIVLYRNYNKINIIIKREEAVSNRIKKYAIILVINSTLKDNKTYLDNNILNN